MLRSSLSIFVITYNRSSFLQRTLEYLSNSLLSSYPITVLDNASTDDTAVKAREFFNKLPNLVVVTNTVNVGPNANFLKAFDYSNSEYTWILCDDDVIDLSEFADVLDVIESGKVPLIHVGAHKQKSWILGGEYRSPKELLQQKYAYFKFSSFMPCNIYKTEKFISEYIVKGYNNIGNAYPHMPYAFGMYEKDELVYISKSQIVVASETGQSYTPKDWYLWWMKTCELLEKPAEVRSAYLNQWKDNGVVNERMGLHSLLDAQEKNRSVEYIEHFISRYFTFADKTEIFLHRLGLSSIRDKLYWAKINFMSRFHNLK